MNTQRIKIIFKKNSAGSLEVVHFGRVLPCAKLLNTGGLRVRAGWYSPRGLQYSCFVAIKFVSYFCFTQGNFACRTYVGIPNDILQNAVTC